MGAFTICAHDYVGVEAETQQQITQEHSMIFTITTSLNFNWKIKYLLLPRMLALNAIVQLFQHLETPVFKMVLNWQIELRVMATQEVYLQP